MEKKYKKITPEQVFLSVLLKEPTEADRWTGRVPNDWGNRASGNDFIDLFAGLIRHYGKRTTAFYAKTMGVEQEQLNITIRTLSGMAVMNWVAYFVVMAADELMADGQTPISFFERLGFNDVRDFSFYYQKHKGIRPTHAAGIRNRYRR